MLSTESIAVAGKAAGRVSNKLDARCAPQHSKSLDHCTNMQRLHIEG